MPYAMAMGCESGVANGLANIDLTGTPFVLDDPFCMKGFQPLGDVIISDDLKVADLTAGGFCGWNGPDPCSIAPHLGNGETFLSLAYE